MAAEEDALERLTELRTKYRIDYWVQRRVEVAEPQEERKECVANLAALAQRHQESGDEERQPADDKSTRDNGQRFCSLAFPLCLQRLFAFRNLRLRIIGRLRARRNDGAVLDRRGHLTGRRGQLMVVLALLLLLDQLNQVMWLLWGGRGCRGTRVALARG